MNSALARKVAPTGVEVVWFVARGSVLKGPYTQSQLEEKIQKREISFFDFCWRQGFQEWRPLFAVNDFERRNRVRRVPPYPTVEVPAGSKTEVLMASPHSQANRDARQGQVERRVQISFSKMRRQSITVYEWASAIVFAAALAYTATNFALNRVMSSVLTKIYTQKIGHSRHMGEAPHAVPPAAWDPLYSAPGFSEMAKVPHHPTSLAPFVGEAHLPVAFRGHVVPTRDGGFRVGPYKIASPNGIPAGPFSLSGLDPVYSQTVELRGYRSPTQSELVWISEAGDPGILGP